ncbi:MAG: hypothetical protein HFJ45_08860 [Clostridia bacterium]|nr:hypothetical protein [Clostridia bacterium]
MQNNKVKNTIVLRGMASNVVDEAIVILKPHVKIKKMEHTKNFIEKNTSKEVILKEAEHVVSEYINKINQDDLIKQKKKLERKIKKLQLICTAFFVSLVIAVII